MEYASQRGATVCTHDIHHCHVCMMLNVCVVGTARIWTRTGRVLGCVRPTTAPSSTPTMPHTHHVMSLPHRTSGGEYCSAGWWWCRSWPYLCQPVNTSFSDTPACANRIVFYISAGIFVFGGLVFALFGSGEVQVGQCLIYQASRPISPESCSRGLSPCILLPPQDWNCPDNNRKRKQASMRELPINADDENQPLLR
jgi:hypothetical protein